MDSYTKFADDFFGPAGASSLFENVEIGDLDEVRVTFALAAEGLEYADNFRVFSINNKKEYYAQASKGCCGSFDSSIRCKSGNVYLIGCNFGH